jgi:protein required for attachment to host cells
MPTRLCLVVADAARARLYTYDPPPDPFGDRVDVLHERADLVNVEARLTPNQRLSDSRPGTAYSPTGLGFGLDDHREENRRDHDRRFADEIAAQLETLVVETGCSRVAVFAPPRMLGILRPAIAAIARHRDLDVEDFTLDLTKEATPRLHDHLAELGVLPARERAGRAP